MPGGRGRRCAVTSSRDTDVGSRRCTLSGTETARRELWAIVIGDGKKKESSCPWERGHGDGCCAWGPRHPSPTSPAAAATPPAVWPRRRVDIRATSGLQKQLHVQESGLQRACIDRHAVPRPRRVRRARRMSSRCSQWPSPAASVFLEHFFGEHE